MDIIKQLMKVILVLSCLVFKTNFLQAITYKVGVEAIPYMPFSEVKDNKYVGKFSELVTKFFTENNLNYEFVPLPISRLHIDFMNKKLDFKLPANPLWKKSLKEEKKLAILYSNSIYKFTDGVMVRPNKLGDGLERLHLLGTVTGFTPWEYLDYVNNKKIQLRENPSLDGVLQQALLGRVDGVYMNIDVAKFYLKQNLQKEGSLIFDDELPFGQSDYHLATIKHPEIIEKFNDFLKENSLN